MNKTNEQPAPRDITAEFADELANLVLNRMTDDIFGRADDDADYELVLEKLIIRLRREIDAP